MSIYSLPPDILRHFFASFLLSDDDRPEDSNAVKLVCKKWKEITEHFWEPYNKKFVSTFLNMLSFTDETKALIQNEKSLSKARTLIKNTVSFDNLEKHCGDFKKFMIISNFQMANYITLTNRLCDELESPNISIENCKIYIDAGIRPDCYTNLLSHALRAISINSEAICIVKILTQHPEIKIEQKHWFDALDAQSPRAIQLLIETGARPTKEVLAYATGILTRTVQKGAQPPRQEFIRCKNYEIIKLLIDAGAIPTPEMLEDVVKAGIDRDRAIQLCRK